MPSTGLPLPAVGTLRLSLAQLGGDEGNHGGSAGTGGGGGGPGFPGFPGNFDGGGGRGISGGFPGFPGGGVGRGGGGVFRGAADGGFEGSGLFGELFAGSRVAGAADAAV